MRVDNMQEMIAVRGHRIAVRVRPGEQTQPPLLLCNGLGAGLQSLGPLVDALRPGRTVIRFDAPGIGASPTPAMPYSMSGLARVVAALVTELGHDRVDVLGFSWGGALAQQLALQHPGRCRRLVLASTTPGVLGVPGPLPALATLLAPHRQHGWTGAHSVNGLLYGGPARAENGSASHRGDGPGLTGSTVGYGYQLLALLGWTSTPWLPLVRQPALILTGRDDPLVPVANARLMRGLLPHARLHLHDGGHLAVTTEPDVLAPVIDEFLDQP